MPQERANDVADLGFDLLANGEDDSAAGYEARAKYLAPLGVKAAGAGLSLAEARLPVFQETPKGLAAFLSACPGIDLCGDGAANATDWRPARAGVNQLGLTVWNTVTAEQLKQLRAIRDSILARRTEPGLLAPSPDPPPEAPGRLVLFGQKYMAADKPGNIHYELDPASEKAANPGRAKREGIRGLRHVSHARSPQPLLVRAVHLEQLSGRLHAAISPQAD